MKFKSQYVKAAVDMYARITTTVVFASALYIVIFWGMEAELTVSLLWQILGISAICALGVPLMLCHEERYPSRRAGFLRNVLQFVYVNGVVLASGFLFRWFLPSSLPMILGMELCIILVYVFVIWLAYVLDVRQAEEMNRKLAQRQKR